MTTVFIADPITDEGLSLIKNDSDFKVVKKTGLKEHELIKQMADVNCLLVRSETKVTLAVIEAAKNLKLIGRAGVGVDNIDRQAATSKGIVVMNVPGGNTISAAEHTMGLMLALSRNIPQANASLKAGEWQRKKFIGVELFDKTLGLIGLGRIGREVSRRAASFGMHIIAFDPFTTEEFAKNLSVRLTDLDSLLKESDYISIHTPKNEQTIGMINKKAFAKMKKNVRIINCSRGGIINEDDLIEAVESERIAGAALDVFSKEPAQDLPVVQMPKIIVTPHLAASTEEAQVKVAVELSRAVSDFFKKGIVRNAINFPVVDPDVLRELTPYIELSEKMGKFLGQIITGGISEIEVETLGEISQYSISPISLAAVTGILHCILDVEINMINASFLAKERGIKIKETKSELSKDYTNLISITITTEKNTYRIAGTLLSHGYPRIVSLNNIPMDIVPSGKMLVIQNMDQPGVIGQLGTILGKSSVNIAEMHVGRLPKSSNAITVIHIDNPVSSDIVKNLHKIKEVQSVFSVELG